MNLSELTAQRLVPVVVLNDAARAEGLAAALVAGGLPVAEVTFRTAAAPEAIRIMARNPDIMVGAGTVLSAAQVDQAADAGATFIVSPGFRDEVVQRAFDRGLLVVPGTVTPTEIMQALAAGITTVKFFPAGTFGGAKAIKALSAPFRDVRFIPTGGVSTENLADYLSLSCVAAVGGSWMVPEKLLDAGAWDEVTRLTRDAVAAAAAI